MSSVLPFLKIGIILDILNWLGKIPCFKDKLNMWVIGVTIVDIIFFNKIHT